MTSRLEPNPNRVGSGFINFGAMERQQQPAANWQTTNLLAGGGGAAAAATPAQVSDIWNSTPSQQPVQPQQQPRLQPQPTPQLTVQPQLAPQPFAAPAPGPAVSSACALFQSLGIDAPPPIRQEPAFPGVGGVSAPNACPNDCLNQFSAMSVSAQPPPQQPSQSLMSLLQTPAPPSNQVNAFQLCNGGVPQGACASRAQAAFSNPIAAAPQCQLPPNGVHSTAFASSAFAPPTAVSHPPPPRAAAPSGVTRSLNSAADYAAAAINYKAPPMARSGGMAVSGSVSRKPEGSKSQPQHTPPKEEWECPRCTFLNNSALRECEMCGFERPGRETHNPNNSHGAHEDDGWRTASATVRKSAPVPSSTQTGKSKTQVKLKRPLILVFGLKLEGYRLSGVCAAT